jgi:hypothetical protein
MAITVKRLLEIAAAEIGYKEKETNAQLDSKGANAGNENYTKYARDLHAKGYYQASKQGYEWCDMFVDWCFLQAAGGDAKKAQAAHCQTGPYGAGCVFSARYFEQAGRLYNDPKPGDQAFFAGYEHTGIVESVTATHVTLIEGNATNAVRRITYARNSGKIIKYGRPKFEAEPAAKPSTPAPAKSIKEVANEVICGGWGNGADRKARLQAAGYDPEAVQAMVNELLKPKAPTKTVDDLAQEVIDGKWGNGADRKKKLEAAGYDYNAVQKRVNQLLS